MKKYYSDFPGILEIQACERYNKEDIWVKILTKLNIQMQYHYTKLGEWEDYHSPPIVLTNKSSALIYLACKGEIESNPHIHTLQEIKENLQSISKYNISKILLLRQLSIQH